MNIAIDYDGTLTAAPALFLGLAESAAAAGHQVWCVTMRYPSECRGWIFDRLNVAGVPTIATSRMAKRPACERLGVFVDVWVDDTPAAVDADSLAIWGTKVPEGSPVDPAAAGPDGR